MHWPGLKPGALNPESSALTIWLLHLPSQDPYSKVVKGGGAVLNNKPTGIFPQIMNLVHVYFLAHSQKMNLIYVLKESKL